MSNRERRIQELGKRFSEQPKKPKSGDDNNNRKRHSLYIDADLMKRVDIALKEVQHDIYPADVTKYLFMEKLLEIGLQNVETVKGMLTTSDE